MTQIAVTKLPFRADHRRTGLLAFVVGRPDRRAPYAGWKPSPSGSSSTSALNPRLYRRDDDHAPSASDGAVRACSRRASPNASDRGRMLSVVVLMMAVTSASPRNSGCDRAARGLASRALRQLHQRLWLAHRQSGATRDDGRCRRPRQNEPRRCRWTSAPKQLQAAWSAFRDRRESPLAGARSCRAISFLSDADVPARRCSPALTDRARSAHAAEPGPVLARITEGIAFAHNDKRLRGVLIVTAIYNVFALAVYQHDPGDRTRPPASGPRRLGLLATMDGDRRFRRRARAGAFFFFFFFFFRGLTPKWYARA